MRLAHLSDPHIQCLDGAGLLDFSNKRILGGLNLLVARGRRYRNSLLAALVEDLNHAAPDHVVLTGDLTSLALPAELALARRLLDGLALGPAGVTLVPGNHDSYVAQAVSGKWFEKTFAPYLSGDGGAGVGDGGTDGSDGATQGRGGGTDGGDGVTEAGGGVTEAGGGVTEAGGGGRYPLLRVRGQLAVVGLSTAQPVPPACAYGRVGERQLAAAVRMLGAPELRDRFRVVLIHHPPTGSRMQPLRGLRDRVRVCSALATAGCELVLHGHEHENRITAIEAAGRRIPVIGVASATATSASRRRGSCYNLYHIEDRSLRCLERHLHDRESGRFVVEEIPLPDRYY